MSSVTSDEMKNIPAERWVEWCATFTNGNRGRLINIELEDDNPEGDLLVEGRSWLPLIMIPLAKGTRLSSATVMMRILQGTLLRRRLNCGRSRI